MSLPPLDSVPLILRPQAWLHRRHYGQVLSPIRWWGRIPWLFYLVSLFVGYIERRRSPLDPVLRSLVSARIAQLCHCEFCIDITSMTLAARSGSQDKLLAVADWRSSTLFSEKSVWRWPMPKPPPRRRRRWMMPCAARWPRILTPGRSPS